MTIFRFDALKSARVGLSSAVLLTCACSAISPAERLCRSHITDGLLNPETAQFFEFRDITKDEFQRQYFLIILKARGISESDRYRFGGAIDEFEAGASDLAEGLMSSGHSFKSFRMKAESRGGLKVTETYFCGVSSTDCQCVSESMASAMISN